MTQPASDPNTDPVSAAPAPRTAWDVCKTIVTFLLKILLAVMIIGYFLYKYHDSLLKSLQVFDYRYLLPACAVYGTHMLVAAWRWWRLALILGVRLSAREALFLTMEGYFFSLVIPGGAIGGDVVKMGIISKRSPSGSKMEGAFSILMDRIVGMIALFALALVLLIPGAGLLCKVDTGLAIDSTILVLLVALLCLAGLGASCVIFFHRFIERLPLFGGLMRFGDRITHGMVTRMTGATDTYAKAWPELLLLIIVSVFGVHIMTTLPLIFLFQGANVSCPLLIIILAVTFGNIIGLLPIFPSGVGGRDAVIVMILIAAGVGNADAVSIQLMYTAILLFFNLLGGVFFVLDRGRKESNLKNDLRQGR